MRQQEPGAYRFGNFAAPFWDPSEGGEYGATSLTGYEKQFHRFNFSFDSGRGLWDFERDPNVRRSPMGEVARVKGSTLLPKPDMTVLRDYAEAHTLPARQQDVVLCITSGMSVRKTAETLGIGRKDVRDCIRAAHGKASRWHSTHAAMHAARAG